MKLIDLHLHTNASDGVLTPERLVEKAKKLGLSSIAITDHDQVSAIFPALKEGERQSIEVIPGVELSCYWTEQNRKEFHILGYFIDFENKEFLEKLAFFQNERLNRAKKILKLLADLGYQSDWQDLLKLATGTIGMPHVAKICLENPKNKERLLTDFGPGASVGDFIEKFMIRGKSCYVQKAGFEPLQAINLIHQVGGVAILAHPCFDLKEGDLITIKALKNWGIDGLEAIAPFKTKQQTIKKINYFSKVARENKLLITGGSDYHGIDGVGAGIGLLEWGMEINQEILQELKIYHQEL